jgi:hypothetical protein
MQLVPSPAGKFLFLLNAESNHFKLNHDDDVWSSPLHVLRQIKMEMMLTERECRKRWFSPNCCRANGIHISVTAPSGNFPGYVKTLLGDGNCGSNREE